MYKSLLENLSKSHYNNILEETMAIVDNTKDKNPTLYACIFEQLEDMKRNVIENRIITEWDEINERYTLGTIAIQEFDEGDEMRNRLSDLFGGAVHYNELRD